jgi:hypothetical protein
MRAAIFDGMDLAVLPTPKHNRLFKDDPSLHGAGGKEFRIHRTVPLVIDPAGHPGAPLEISFF